MDYDTVKDELLAAADTTLKYTKSLDADADFEIFLIYDQTAEASYTQGVVTAKDGAAAGNAVRVALGNRVGFACATGVTEDRIKLSAQEALSIIRSVNADDDRFKSFADPKAPGRESTFDKKILELGIDDLIRDSEILAKNAMAVDERVKSVSGNTETSWGGYAVTNSRGISSSTRYGYSAAQAYVQVMEGEERRESFEFDVTIDRVYSTDGLAEKTANNALSLLGAKKLDMTEKITTIWTPIPAATYIMSSLGQSVVGAPVVEGISPLNDMIGDSVGPSNLTIVDDGQSKTGLGTNAIDGEGIPQRRNPVIANGILKSFLFDSYYGTAFGVDSTGNCDRSGGGFGGNPQYENSPSASTKWLEVTAGKKTEEQMISEIDGKAILIRDFPIGIFHTSVATGEFSVVAASAFLVENGELKHSIEPVSIAGSFYEGFKNLIGIGSNVEPLPFGIAVPTLVFDGFSVTG
ncbi:MAG: TldD/PmbA family protein [Candidatus Thorarchaeota archaeon]|jgi:PmbA protein